MFDNVVFCVQAVAPMALLIFLGWFLRRVGILTEGFRQAATKLLFSVALPVFLFTKTAGADLSGFSPAPVIAGVCSTLIMFFMGWLILPHIEKDPAKYGVMVQGAYRSNFAILGIPLVSAIYGSASDLAAVSLLTVVVPLYSTLAVIILTPASEQAAGHGAISWGSRFRSILTNPLILSTMAGIPFSLLHIDILHMEQLSFLTKAMGYVTDLTLPLGMLCVGASFSAVSGDCGECDREHLTRNTIIGVAAKLVLSPLVTLGLGYALGCRGVDLGVLMVLVCGPCSVTSYIMASAMGGNRLLASKLVAYTTVLSAVTIVAGCSVIPLLV